jgi:DNA-binding NarL/FixJ family response regulator
MSKPELEVSVTVLSVDGPAAHETVALSKVGVFFFEELPQVSPRKPEPVRDVAAGQALLRVVLVDSHPLMRGVVRRVLEDDGSFDVVAEAVQGREVLPLIAQHVPDVVLLEVQPPGRDELVILERLEARYPDVKVIVFSDSLEPSQVVEAFRAGACGYVARSIAKLDLCAAVRQAVEGTSYHAVELPPDLAGPALAAGLTKREAEVLRAVARGLATKTIADELWLSTDTVKSHLTGVYRKLGVRNRTEAARWAVEQGLAAGAAVSSGQPPPSR